MPELTDVSGDVMKSENKDEGCETGVTLVQTCGVRMGHRSSEIKRICQEIRKV